MKSVRKAVEWVGGVVSFPGSVVERDVPYNPEVLVWLGPDGTLLGSEMGKPGEVVASAARSLTTAMTEPLHGAPHTPARVRVASKELADVLRAGHPTLEIVHAATPELAAVEASLRANAMELSDDATYLGEGVRPDHVAALFHAAADFHRAAPWESVPAGMPIAVTVDELGLEDVHVLVLGQDGISQALLLFEDEGDLAKYCAAVEQFGSDSAPPLPSFLSLSFERGADLELSLRKEIAQHGWEVASADAYPNLQVLLGDERAFTSPTVDEIVDVEAITRGLTDMLVNASPADLARAWAGTHEVTYRGTVICQVGAVTVTVRAPASAPEAPSEPAPKAKAKTKAKSETREGTSKAPASKAKPKAGAGRRFQIKIALVGTRIPVWRRVIVPADIHLDDLHRVVQHAMGWEDCHLHGFEIGRTHYGPEVMDFGPQVVVERDVVLGDVARRLTKIRYEYDFGDAWQHELVVEAELPPDESRAAILVDGKGACPPEDAGGIWGYEATLEALADPDHPEHEEAVEWLGRGFAPDRFERAEADARLAELSKTWARPSKPQPRTARR